MEVRFRCRLCSRDLGTQWRIGDEKEPPDPRCPEHPDVCPVSLYSYPNLTTFEWEDDD